MQEAEYLLNEIKECEETCFHDTDYKVYDFLKNLYEYETNRTPIHKAFKSNYRLDYFDASKMLEYYMNPLNVEKETVYFVDTLKCNFPYPIIYKTKNNKT